MRISYAPVSANPSGASQNYLAKMAQDALTKKFQRAFSAPFDFAAHGSRKHFPEVDTLTKHVRYGDNKAPETLAKLASGYKAIGLTKEQNCGMFLTAASVVRAMYPMDAPFCLSDWNELETQLQGEFDCIQVKLWRGDLSAKTLTDAHERLTKLRDMIDRALEWIEKRLYGGVQ